jgi:heavy metal sensor kinase
VLGPGGDLFQVCNDEGVWLYRSASLEAADVPIQRPDALGSSNAGDIADRVVQGVPLRFLSRSVSVLGRNYTVQVAAPTGEMEEGLVRYRSAFLVLIPSVLVIAFSGGWWLSGRALAPVDAITRTARSIGDRNLAQRLPVPPAEDELSRLSATLNEMLDRIEGAFRRITEFTADASHELRTPVALMRTTAEIALRKERSGGEYKQALREILEESERTTGLIENLLTLARADAGRAELRRGSVDVAGLLSGVEEPALKLAQPKGVDFRLVCDNSSEERRVRGDAAVLRRLLLILLDNAVKYTSAGGTVWLSCQAPDLNRVRIEVRDTGMGIHPDDLPRIFERFYRAEKSRNREYGGAGLGLSLAKWIVEAHDGTIRVDSRVDEGSTFMVDLPAFEPGVRG